MVCAEITNSKLRDAERRLTCNKFQHRSTTTAAFARSSVDGVCHRTENCSHVVLSELQAEDQSCKIGAVLWAEVHSGLDESHHGIRLNLADGNMVGSAHRLVQHDADSRKPTLDGHCHGTHLAADRRTEAQLYERMFAKGWMSTATSGVTYWSATSVAMRTLHRARHETTEAENRRTHTTNTLSG